MVEAARPVDGVGPAPLDDVPRRTEAGRVGRPHPRPVGVATVELCLDQRRHVDAVDHEVRHLAVDPDVDHLDAPQDGAGQIDAAEAGAGQVDGAELGAGQVDAVEPRPGQVDAVEPRPGQVDAVEPRPAQVVPGELGHGHPFP